jgi:hypothetical protein
MIGYFPIGILQIPLVPHESFRISLILHNALHRIMNSSIPPNESNWIKNGYDLWHWPQSTAIRPRIRVDPWRLQFAQALVKPFLPQGTSAPNDPRPKGIQDATWKGQGDKDRRKRECFMGRHQIYRLNLTKTH